MSYSDWGNKVQEFKTLDVQGIQGNFFPGLKKQAASLPPSSGRTRLSGIWRSRAKRGRKSARC